VRVGFSKKLNAIRKWLAAEKVRSGHEQRADPGDRERQRKIAGDRVAVKEGFVKTRVDQPREEHV
jgi:hypothetical protein